MILILLGIMLRIREITRLEKAVTTITDMAMTMDGFICTVTASAEQIPRICTVIGLLLFSGSLISFRFFKENNGSFGGLTGRGNGLGYGLILVMVSAVRELFGSGKLMGFQVVPDAAYRMGYFNNGLTILPPMALIIVGIIIWIQRSRNPKLIENK